MSINNLDKFQAVTRSRTAIGTVISLSDPAVSELAGECGLDFTWIDAEHAPLTIQDIMAHIIALRGTDCAPFVRVPWNEWGVIKPILDLMPAAVIIPMVNSAEMAREAVSFCRYPPVGTRGCGVRRGNRYGAVDFKSYLRESQSNPMVIVQIEHIDAVRNLDAILAVEGIDSICIGPYDLSGSMGLLGEMNHPELNRVMDEIAAKTLRAGIMLGTASAPLQRWLARGVQWIAMTSDCGAMAGSFRQLVADARQEQQK